MNLYDARDLAVRLMKEFQLFGWRFRFDSARRRFGQCSYRDRVISLSKYLVAINGRSQVEDTIRHEIAHAVIGPGHGHGYKWKQSAVACGASPVRCYDSETVSAPQKPFVGKCPSCGVETKAFRRTRIACKRCCGGKFDPQFLFQWRRVV